MSKTTVFMRDMLLAAAIAALAILPGHADTMKNCAAAWDAMTPAAKAQTSYKEYSTTCLKKGSGAGLTSTSAPAGATGQCKDGTYTSAKTHSGACAKHGGVAKWLM